MRVLPSMRGTRYWPLLVGLLAIPLAGADARGHPTGLHTELTESVPADGALLAGPPSEVVLRFSTPVQVALSRVHLVLEDSTRLELGDLAFVAGSEEHTVAAAVPMTLPAGTIRVEWWTAGPDGHPIRGSFAFVVDPAGDRGLGDRGPPLEGSGPSQAAADTASTQDTVQAPQGTLQTTRDTVVEAVPSTADSLPGPEGAMGGTEVHGGPDGAAMAEAVDQLRAATAPPGLVHRWGFLLSLILAVGVVSFRWSVVGPALARKEAETVAWALRRLRRVAVVVGMALVATAVSGLVLQVTGLFGGFGGSGSGMTALLFGSAWGIGWWMHLGAGLLFLCGALLMGGDGGVQGGWLLATLAVVPLVFVPAMTGHAWGTLDARAVAVTADVVHVLTAGVWLGGLGMLVGVGLPALSRQKGELGEVAALPAWVDSFSRLALVAFVLLVLSGLTGAWLHLGSLRPLVTTPYGWVLLLKVLLLTGPLVLGFYNWRGVRPSLRHAPFPRLVRIPAVLEFGLGVLVVGVAAVLIVLHLP